MPPSIDTQISMLMWENDFCSLDESGQKKSFTDHEKVQQLISLHLLKEMKETKKTTQLLEEIQKSIWLVQICCKIFIASTIISAIVAFIWVVASAFK